MSVMAIFGDVANITMGQAPSGDTYNSDHDGLPLIAGAGDFGELTPSPKKYTSAPTKTCEPGDIIMSIRATIGTKVTSDNNYCLGRGVVGLRANDRLDQGYLWYWLTHIEPTLKLKGRGATFPQVSRSDIASLEIPLPPLSEQKRIAAILDKADQLRQKRKQAIALLDSLTQSIFLEMFGDPVSNPKGWKMASIFDVSTKVTDGTHDTPRRTTAGVPFLTGKNIRPYIVDLSQIEYVDEQTHKEIFRRCNPEMGDVLYTNIGAGVGAAALNRLTYEFSLKNVALIKPNRKLMTGEFLELVLNNSKFKSRLLEQYAQGGAQKFLGLATIKKIQIPVPPLNDLSSLTSRLMILEPIRISLQDRIRRAHALFSSLQHHAFSGQL